MQIIVILRSTMRFIGLTPQNSLVLTIYRWILIISLIYLNATEIWYILYEGTNFGDIAVVVSSVDMYLDVLLVYVLYLIIRKAFFNLIEEMGNIMDERKIDQFEAFKPN